MSNAKVIFSLDGTEVTIQCTQNDKMANICQKYALKIETNINSLFFLYGGAQLNLNLSFKEQASSIDRNNNRMKVLVYKNEEDGFNCPKCGSKIQLNLRKVKDIISLNDNILKIIMGMKVSLANIIKAKNTAVDIYFQLENITTIEFNKLNDDIKKNNEKLKNLLNELITTSVNEKLKSSNNNNINNINTINNNNNNNHHIKTYDEGKYEGQLKDNKREGKGTMLYNNGDKYEGEWKNDVIEGRGKFYWNDGEIYEGDWKNGVRDGKGIDIYIDKEKYEGDWKNDLREGRGIYYYLNGDRYEGDYKNHEKNGKGIYYYKNGNRYEGDFINDSIGGKGVFYYNNGDREMGDFSQDMKIGKHVILRANGDVSTNVYNNNFFHYKSASQIRMFK